MLYKLYTQYLCGKNRHTANARVHFAATIFENLHFFCIRFPMILQHCNIVVQRVPVIQNLFYWKECKMLIGFSYNRFFNFIFQKLSILRTTNYINCASASVQSVYNINCKMVMSRWDLLSRYRAFKIQTSFVELIVNIIKLSLENLCRTK